MTSGLEHIDFYHYTSRSGMEQIKACGYIREGSFDHHGPGVYGTTLPPSKGKLAISRNNWRGGWKRRMEEGRADYAIYVRLPKDKVVKCETWSQDLYKYPGILTLSNYEWTVMKDILIGREKSYEVQNPGLLDAAPKDLKVCLGLEFLMQDSIRNSWNFTEMDGHQLFPSTTTRNLEDILCQSHLQIQSKKRRTCSNQSEKFPCCCYNRKPLRIEWALEERPGCMPSKWFQCAIRVGYSTTFDPEPLHFLENVRIETLHVNDLELKEAKNSSSQTDLCETHESRAARPSSIPSFNEGFQPSSLQPTMPVPNYTINNIHVNTLKGQVIAANENVQHSISATVLQDNMSTVSSAEPVMEIESPHIQPDSENGN